MERPNTITNDPYYNLCFAVYKQALIDLDCALRNRQLYGSDKKPDSIDSYIRFLKYSTIAEYVFDEPEIFVNQFLKFDKELIEQGIELDLSRKLLGKEMVNDGI